LIAIASIATNIILPNTFLCKYAQVCPLHDHHCAFGHNASEFSIPLRLHVFHNAHNQPPLRHVFLEHTPITQQPFSTLPIVALHVSSYTHHWPNHSNSQGICILSPTLFLYNIYRLAHFCVHVEGSRPQGFICHCHIIYDEHMEWQLHDFGSQPTMQNAPLAKDVIGSHIVPHNSLPCMFNTNYVVATCYVHFHNLLLSHLTL
jgi:hypothetical protein